MLLAAALGACTGTTPPDLLDRGVATTGTCQRTCTPDPLPRLVDCQAEEVGLELVYLSQYDEDAATSTYSYTDRTAAISNFVLQGTSGDPMSRTFKTWEPPTAPLERCRARSGNRALHIQGGPFLGWGGGVGFSMINFALAKATCFGPPASQPDFCTPQSDLDLDGAMFDFSKYEGISFWARRGPDSQGGIRVAIGDKHTDDDVAFRMYATDAAKPPADRRPLYCERVRECACVNHMPCRAFQASRPEDFSYAACPPKDEFYCGPPKPLMSGEYAAGANVQCNTCQSTRCNERFPAFPGEDDRQFLGKACTPHTFRNGITSAYCFDPAAGEAPAESDRQCGDHWMAPVALTNEWRLYKVPFTSLLQQGFGQRSVKLDLTALSLVRFTWDGGWVDYWIDDVAFYRRKP